MNDFYPILISLKHKKVCVIGGGNVAFRKVKNLIPTGAEIHVISPEITQELMDLSNSQKIIYHKKSYEAFDIKDAWLVFAATDKPEINNKILKDAEKQKCFCNVADSPEDCAFIVPSVIKRGDLTLAISTGGNIPALTKKIREKLEIEFPENYGIYIKFLGELRNSLKDKYSPEKRMAISRELAGDEPLDLFLSNDWTGLEKWIMEKIGIDAEKILLLYKK